MRTTRRLLLSLMLGATPAALLAQAAQPGPAQPGTAPDAGAPAGAGMTGEEEDEGTILVTGQRPPGSVLGNVPPEVTLNPGDIRSYGVSSVTDLLNELTPQTTSGRGGAPVVLLNGRRISGFGELRDLPTEAIMRVDILPEEVALKYGYTADQKVVNFVLRPRFRALTTELTGSTSTEGGGDTKRIQSSALRINKAGRTTLSLDYRKNGSLLESDRGITSAPLRQPFDRLGNIGGIPNGVEIDPALSAIAQSRVTIAGVPAVAAIGQAGLANFAANANLPNVTDVRDFRTLRAATDQLTLNTVVSRTIFGDVPITFNGTFEATGSEGLRGLAGSTLQLPAGNPYSPFARAVNLYRYLPDQSPLTQSVAGNTAHAGVAMNGDVGSWRWTFTGTYDRALTRTATATGIDVSALQAQINANAAINPFGAIDGGLIAARAPDRARALSNSGDAEAVFTGTLFALPAGDVSTTLKLGADIVDFDTRSTRSGLFQSADLSRRTANGQANFDLPITSLRNGVLSAIGDLSANFNVAATRYSDFGTLTTIGYGLTWKPRDGITLLVSRTDDEGAPSIQQLGNPQIATSAIRVFDYLKGTTVDITRVDGGNPALLANDRHVTRIGFNLKPFEKTELRMTANYTRTRTANQTATLPQPTAAIEAAFPDRFLRDVDGTLLRIDNRPVNFAEENSQQLRWGFNLSLPLKASQRMIEAMRVARERRQAEAAARGETGANGASPRDGAPAGGPPRTGDAPGGGGGAAGGARRPGGFGGGPPGGFGGRGPNGGRVQLALYHTWVFRDDILIREGLPLLDQLNGAAAGFTGGQPRHALEAQAGFTRLGIGARLNANWQSGTFVRGGASSATGDLDFSSLTTANLRVFFDAAQMPLFTGKTWARGLRLSFGVNNLFNQRLRVTDSTGATPLSYQPGYIDPIGRQVQISIRKLLF